MESTSYYSVLCLNLRSRVLILHHLDISASTLRDPWYDLLEPWGTRPLCTKQGYLGFSSLMSTLPRAEI